MRKKAHHWSRCALLPLFLALPVLAGCALHAERVEASSEAPRSGSIAYYDDGLALASEAEIGVDSRGLGGVSMTLGNLDDIQNGLESLNFGRTALQDSDGDGLPDSRGPQEGSIARKMIHAGSLTLAVADPVASREMARQKVEALGGYVESEQDTNLRLRVPAGKWREGFESIAALGREISRSIRVQDVTEEFYDVELRLKNARELSDRFALLLEKAETVKDALEIEKELSRVRTEIESLEGRMRLLSQRVAYATLDLSLRVAAEAPQRGASLPFPWLRNLGVENLMAGGRR